MRFSSDFKAGESSRLGTTERRVLEIPGMLDFELIQILGLGPLVIPIFFLILVTVTANLKGVVFFHVSNKIDTYGIYPPLTKKSS